MTTRVEFAGRLASLVCFVALYAGPKTAVPAHLRPDIWRRIATHLRIESALHAHAFGVFSG